MRKLFLLPAILLGALLIFQSCSKESADTIVAATPDNIINATIARNQTYQMNISSVGSESISKQASHFEVSRTEVDSKSGLPVYKYKPALDYTGTDEVVLSKTTAVTMVNRSCNGNDYHNNNAETTSYKTAYTIIKIKITN